MGKSLEKSSCSQVQKEAQILSWWMDYSDWMYENWAPFRMFSPMFGYDQAKNTQKSLQAQIDYEQYLRRGNERALRDWYKNVGIPQGRTIRYPEFSYAGQIYRSNTSASRAGFDYSTADANYVGNFPYRSAGLYGIASRLARSL